MRLIDASLPPTDGVACFNRMYALVTDSVQQHLDQGAFADPAWLTTLDVVFGNLYLAAIEQPEAAPRSWAALLERRADPRVVSLQFALAGMNAHINRDLPVAVVKTCLELNTSPESGPHRADYELVDSVLAEVEPVIRQSFEDALLQRALPGAQDVLTNFNLHKARQTAWGNATTLWALNLPAPLAAANFLDALDHLVGFAGRGLLLPLS